MNMKKILCGVLATSMALSFASVAAFAASPAAINTAYDSDGAVSGDVKSGAVDWSFMTGGDHGMAVDGVTPGVTFYIPLNDAVNKTGITLSTNTADTKYMMDGDYFKFDVKKDEGSKMIKKISLVTEKTLGSLNRTDYVKVELNDSTTTSELKSTGTITFKAKSDASSYTGNKAVDAGNVWKSGDTYTIDYNFWINNTKVTNDSNPGTGDRVYFDPDKNDTNTLIWGDDRAAIKFDSDDDATKFYARMSTKINSDLYVNYGDPVNADLYFYDFVGSSAIPSTSRAILTLGIPWEEDDDYVPDPANCFIYQVDADGNLTDVTSSFKYSDDDEEIPGWSTRVRSLGSYVLSDTELDVDAINDGGDVTEEPAVSEPSTSAPVIDNGGKDLPNTGANDMVNVAMVAAVVSLAAAGAVAFKKFSK